MLNLLLGVIFANFSLAEQSQSFKDLNQNQIEWIAIQKKILKVSPLSYSPPKTGLRSKILHLIRDKKFKKIILATIFLNVVALGLHHDQESESFQKAMKIILGLVTLCYFLEFLMKVSCYGVLAYIQTKIFMLEFFIMFGYLVDFAFDFFSIFDGFEKNELNSILISIKCIKLLSIIRLFFYLKALKRIIRNLAFSLKTLSNLLYLILIIFFFYATLGNFLFRDVGNGVIIQNRINFKSIPASIMTLFKCMTCDNWIDIMYDIINSNCEHCGSGKIFLFYILS